MRLCCKVRACDGQQRSGIFENIFFKVRSYYSTALTRLAARQVLRRAAIFYKITKHGTVLSRSVCMHYTPLRDVTTLRTQCTEPRASALPSGE